MIMIDNNLQGDRALQHWQWAPWSSIRTDKGSLIHSLIHSFIHSFMGMRMIICLSSVVMLILFGMMLLIIINNSICASLIIHTPGAHLCKGPQIEFSSCFNMRKLFRKSRKKFRTSWKCVFKFYDYENANTLEEWKVLQNLFGAKLKLLISNK